VVSDKNKRWSLNNIAAKKIKNKKYKSLMLADPVTLMVN